MKSIVETAVDDGHFTTLVKAVQTAGLADTLSEPGPLTVFAPSDAAFAKLPEGTIDSLLQNKAQLTSILAYHVVAGKYMAGDVKKHGTLPTLQGQSVKVEVHRLYHRGIKINNAEVIHPDIECSNGVIHVIDSVLMPK
jgi:uncharacterized surface protein with fasciclin (FAS1) repeats